MQQFDKLQIRALIGLGNPGSKYYKTRHSIGFRVLDALAAQLGVSWQQGDKMEYAAASVTTDGAMRTVYLIKPMTFMNSSGQVLPFLQKKGIKPAEILVAHDELEKPFGFAGVSFSGSAKGHNGLRSIMGLIGQDFWRLKCGIGRPADKADVPDYVLTNFSASEEAQLGDVIDKALRTIGF